VYIIKPCKKQNMLHPKGEVAPTEIGISAEHEILLPYIYHTAILQAVFYNRIHEKTR
jgi:hypothetical protein